MSKSNQQTKRQDIRETKRATVLAGAKKSHRPAILLVFAIAVIGGALAASVGLFKPEPETATVTSAAAQIEQAEAVTYPVSLFDDCQARHYELKNGDMTIRYFILKSADGVIRAAFDACDVCWPEGKGYYQQTDTMVCRNCGRRFDSVRINEVKGGCNPAPLTRSVNGDQLVIKVDDILQGEAYNDGGTTIIMVTHRAECAGHANRRIELCDGRLVNPETETHGIKAKTRSARAA